MLTKEQLQEIGAFFAFYKKIERDNLVPDEGTAQRTELNNILDRLYANGDWIANEDDLEQQIKDYYVLFDYLRPLNLDKVEKFAPDTVKNMRDIIKEAPEFYEKLTSIFFTEPNVVNTMIKEVGKESYENYNDDRFRNGLQTTLKENQFFTFSDIPNDILKSNKSIWGKPSEKWTDMETTFNELRVLAPDVELQFSNGSPEDIQKAMEEYQQKLEETIEKAQNYTQYKSDQFEKKNRKPKNNERLRIATAKKIQAYAELKLEELSAYKERVRTHLGKSDIAIVAEREAQEKIESLKNLDSPLTSPRMEEQTYFSKMQDNLKVIENTDAIHKNMYMFYDYFHDASNMNKFSKITGHDASVQYVQKSLIYGLCGLSSDEIVVNDCLNFIVKGEASQSLLAMHEKLDEQLYNGFPKEEDRLPALEKLQNIAFENFTKIFSAVDSLDANYCGTVQRLNDFFFNDKAPIWSFKKDLANGSNALSEDNQEIYAGICCVGKIAKSGIEAWGYLTTPGIEQEPEHFAEGLADYLTMRIVETECKRFKSLDTGKVNPIFKDLGTGDSEKNIKKLTEAVKNTEVFKRLNRPGEVNLANIMNSKNSKIDEVLTDAMCSIVGKNYLKAPKAAKAPEKANALPEAEKAEKAGKIKALPDEKNAGMGMGR